MPIAIGNKRLPVTLDEKRQKELQQLKQKYGKVNPGLCVLR
ncbi:hypothetical protein [Enterococcus faecium]